MNPLGSRARSAELARLLDGAALVGGSAAVAAPYAALAGRLVGLGAELDPAVAMRAEFRSALRTRLLAVASVQSATSMATATSQDRGGPLDMALSWSQSRRGQRGIGLAAGAMASVVAVAGVAVAGTQSLPGDPFYGVKRGGEALELRTAGGDVAKGSRHLQFAAERLKEVRELTLGRDAAFAAAPGRPVAAGALGGSASARVRGALADMDRDTRIGSALLTRVYRSSHRDAPLEILSRFAGRQSLALRALMPALPSSVRPRAQLSLALVSGVAVDAGQLLAVGVCTGLCAPSQAAPVLPGPAGPPGPVGTGPVPAGAQPGSDAPCGCQPARAPTRTAAPAAATTSPAPKPSATPSPAPGPATSAPQPAASPTPVPAPAPSVPVPAPTPPLPLPTVSPLRGAVLPVSPLG